MTLTWSNFIYDELITRDSPFLLNHMPKLLQETIVTAWDQHYEELYEDESDGTISLEDTLSQILDLFQSKNQLLGQLRYVWMALILAVVVEPTVKYYQPNNPFPEATINRLTNWLLETIAETSYTEKQLAQNSEDGVDLTSADINSLFAEQKISSFQILSEALDVYISAIKTLELSQALQSLLDILDDCLEGYAIFPGSYGRRELFDWWLLDIVPSSWYLLPPHSMYFLSQSISEDSIAYLSKLEEMSLRIWLCVVESFSQTELEQILPRFEDSQIHKTRHESFFHNTLKSEIHESFEGNELSFGVEIAGLDASV